MKRTRSNDVTNNVAVGRVSRITAFGVVLCVTVMGFTALAGRSQAAEPALAPQLLFDADEIAAYLDEFPKGDYQIAEVPDLGRFYIDDNPAEVKKKLLNGKPWEPYVIKELEKRLAPGDTVLDIGAHIGSLTVPMARLIGPEGTVYAFEPQRKIYRELVHNLKLNEVTNAVPLRFALSSKTGIIEMDPILPTTNPISTAILKILAAIERRNAREHGGRVRVGKGGDKVEARTIDSFGFSDVSLMKIDVEGHEAEVLRGAEKTISALHPVIIIEIWERNREVVMSILKGYGYSVRPISFYDDYIAAYEPKP